MAGAPCDRRPPAAQEMRREHETALSRLAATERRGRGEAAPSDGGVASGRGADEESELRTLLPILEKVERVLRPRLLVVKNAPLKRLVLKCRLVDAAEGT